MKITVKPPSMPPQIDCVSVIAPAEYEETLRHFSEGFYAIGEAGQRLIFYFVRSAPDFGRKDYPIVTDNTYNIFGLQEKGKQ